MANNSNLIVMRDKNGNPIISIKDITGDTQKNWEGEIYNYVWNTSTLAWDKMSQPVLEATNSVFYAKIDGVEGLLTDIKANQTNKTQYIKITDGTDDAEVVAGANTGVKGLRVYGGPTDPISDIPVYIPYDHHQIHEGETFRWSTLQTAGLNAGSSYDIVFTVPTLSSPALLYAPHFRWEIVADAYATAFFYESPTVTGGTGTARTPIPLERNGTYTPKLAITDAPTVTVVGNLIWQGLLLASKTSSAGADSPSNEFVLKSNTSYLFRFTSQTNGCKFLLRFVWYEDLGV